MNNNKKKESIAKGLETRRINKEKKIAEKEARMAQRNAAKTKFITDNISTDSTSQQAKIEKLFDVIEELTQKLQTVESEFERYRDEHPHSVYVYDS